MRLHSATLAQRSPIHASQIAALSLLSRLLLYKLAAIMPLPYPPLPLPPAPQPPQRPSGMAANDQCKGGLSNDPCQGGLRNAAASPVRPSGASSDGDDDSDDAGAERINGGEPSLSLVAAARACERREVDFRRMALIYVAGQRAIISAAIAQVLRFRDRARLLARAEPGHVRVVGN